MNALILSAGFGTRLLPHTQQLPKPLFPINGQPLLDTAIRRLMAAGARVIVVNTHHLHHRIETFIQKQQYPATIILRHEKTLLGTGGAVKNAADVLGEGPFLVINSDILTDIDLSSVMRFHNAHPHPATLVMHDYPEFNKVRVTRDGYVTDFDTTGPVDGSLPQAFTGIQALDPRVLAFIPEGRFSSIIDVYKTMLAQGLKIRAYPASGHRWRDVGTPAHFFEAAVDASAPLAFEKAFGPACAGLITRTMLSGDGSDRRWFRLLCNGQSLVMADHGIQTPAPGNPSEASAFFHIGRHLNALGLPAPVIHYADLFAGLVYVEDLGDTHLQTAVLHAPDAQAVLPLYRKVIDGLIALSVEGGKSFDPAWTWQTPSYDREVILERECRYFVEALLNGYFGMKAEAADFADAFHRIADQALEHGEMGFMHRDCQSRNILVKGGHPYFIDFQGGRRGPLQYDLASLLTDPYVQLIPDIQNTLLDYAITRLSQIKPINPRRFLTSYHACALARILQSLGAFAHLTRVKRKPFFEPFIPVALANLENRLGQTPHPALAPLQQVVTAARNLLSSPDLKGYAQ